MWRLRKIDIVIIGLIIIGFVSKVSANPQGYVIPIVILGLVFLLYKFPPNRFKGMHSKQRSSRHANRPNLRVIQGNKKDDDDTPRYH